MLTLQQLRYLLAVADSASFSEAARQLNLQQPTVSQQIATLEHYLSNQLVVRGRNGCALTAAGNVVAQCARAVFMSLDKMEAELHRSSGHVPLGIGVAPSVGAYLFRLIMAQFRVRMPLVEIQVKESLAAKLIDDLESGLTDCAILSEPRESYLLEAIPLYREDLVVLMPSDHHAAHRSSIVPADIFNDRVLTLEHGHQLHEKTLAFCRAHGLRVDTSFETTSLDTVREMVSAGVGVSIMPFLYAKAELEGDNRVCFHRFEATPLSRTVYLVRRKKGTVLIENTIKTLIEIIRGAVANEGCALSP